MHIDVHKHAEEDLAEISKTDPDAVADVLAVLEQLEADRRVFDKLTTYGNSDLVDDRINVKKWIEASKKVRNGSLWRFRALDCPATNYRVIYGYHWPNKQICVLAVVHKTEIDYDSFKSGIGQRVLSDWAAI
jgi:mRNA-degrading endonuclease RelE of RelBE toxin-antitoxin system